MNPRLELTKARKQAGLSQRELAERARLPQSTVARIESGVVSPRIDTFEWLLSLCGYRLAISRLGKGVDRTMIRELLKLTPDERVDLAVREARNVNEFLASVRR
jgi:transcriptional regulator with XRE-family HTH domain